MKILNINKILKLIIHQQKQQLMELGWTSPSATNPNYSLTIANTEYGRNKAARIITETNFFKFLMPLFAGADLIRSILGFQTSQMFIIARKNEK